MSDPCFTRTAGALREDETGDGPTVSPRLNWLNRIASQTESITCSRTVRTTCQDTAHGAVAPVDNVADRSSGPQHFLIRKTESESYPRTSRDAGHQTRNHVRVYSPDGPVSTWALRTDRGARSRVHAANATHHDASVPSPDPQDQTTHSRQTPVDYEIRSVP